MIKFLNIFIIVLLIQNKSFALSNEKLKRLMYKAKTNISKTSIESYCYNEDPGLNIDSEIAEIMMYSKQCRCAIKSGKEKDIEIVKEILNLCGL